MSAWDNLIQQYAVVISLFLLNIIFAERYPDEKIRLYAKLFFADIFLILLVGLFLPAHGKWALFFRWHALLSTLLGLTVSLLVVIRQLLIRRLERKHQEFLDELKQLGKSSWDASINADASKHKAKIERTGKITFYIIVVFFALIELVTIFFLWLLQ